MNTNETLLEQIRRLNELEYWLDELNKITPDDSSVTTAEGMTPSFCTVKGGVQ